LLGLKQLFYFVTSDSMRAQEVYDIATDKDKWYFFAAAGINITGKLIEIIEVSITSICYNYLLSFIVIYYLKS